MPHQAPNQPQARESSAPAADSVRRNPFTTEQLIDAWSSYIQTHPHEHVVINTMRMAMPHKVSDTEYEIEVQNPSQVEFIESSMSQLLSHLRNAVGNDMLALQVKISDKGPAAKIWSPREIVSNIQQHNPKFNKFIEDFELGLV